jgi:bifunctional DNA-binding transcriptional regulator/antitoxin component of YhaV-PrlF toxin-antitoxin module
MGRVQWNRRIQKRGGSLQVTLPNEICKALDLKDKDEVLIYLEEDTLIIRKESDRCPHCYGTGTCRCSACAKKFRLFDRPILIPVTCTVCNGSGKKTQEDDEKSEEEKL